MAYFLSEIRQIWHLTPPLRFFNVIYISMESGLSNCFWDFINEKILKLFYKFYKVSRLRHYLYIDAKIYFLSSIEQSI